MVDISIIEFVAFGFTAYSSLLMLIISTIKDVPMTRSLAGLRAIYLMPGIICSGILAFSGVNIVFNHLSTNTLGYNGTKLILNQTATTTNYIPLQIPFWQTFHFLIMIVMIIYVLVQIFNVIGKTE